MKDTPHIAIEIPDNFPIEFDRLILDGLKHDSLDLRFVRKEPRAWAAIEWAIPGLIAVYILKPYFESFFKEAGKDHYIILKNKLSVLLTKSKDMKVQTLTSSGTTDKLNATNTQSKAISIFIQTKRGKIIKLLYDNNLSLETWLNATEKILDIVEEDYSLHNEDSFTEFLNKLNEKDKSTIYALIDPETKEWLFFADLYKYEIQSGKEKN
jgi:hypothetical protein